MNKTKSDKWFKKLENNLKLLDITFDDFHHNYKYAGGDTGRHLNYFKKSYPNIEKPEYKNNCVCGHKLVENCYITKDNLNFLVVGNCCIKKFIVKSYRTCSQCEKKHRNTKVNLCNECRKKKDIKTCFHCNKQYKRGLLDYCFDCGKLCRICMQNNKKYGYDKCTECMRKERIELFKSLPKDECKKCQKLKNPMYDLCYSCFQKKEKPHITEPVYILNLNEFDFNQTIVSDIPDLNQTMTPDKFDFNKILVPEKISFKNI